MKYLGIDPGLSGGAAILEIIPGTPPRLLALVDIPVHGEKAKRRVDTGKLFRWIKVNAPDVAFIERAQAFADQGASSGFIYGRAVGALEACVICAGVPLHFVEASVWKRAAGLPGGAAGKEASRQRAILLFPDSADFGRKKDHQRAEAVLIAKHGAERLRAADGWLPIASGPKATSQAERDKNELAAVLRAHSRWGKRTPND